jgi:hypothetical protein
VSVVKSLMFPRHKKVGERLELLDGDFKNTLMMAMREAYIGDYGDVAAFCDRVSEVKGFDLKDFQAHLHEDYCAGLFSFDYVKPSEQ